LVSKGDLCTEAKVVTCKLIILKHSVIGM
jgi:hypothetical protein